MLVLPPRQEPQGIEVDFPGSVRLVTPSTAPEPGTPEYRLRLQELLRAAAERGAAGEPPYAIEVQPRVVLRDLVVVRPERPSPSCSAARWIAGLGVSFGWSARAHRLRAELVAATRARAPAFAR